MFERIKDYFEGTAAIDEALLQDGEVSPKDLVVAACVLLVEVASIDSKIDPAEGSAVVKALSGEFGVPEQAVPELVQLAIAARKEQGKVRAFVELLTNNFSEEQRQQVLVLVWKVIFADGQVEEEEEKLARFLTQKLQLSEDQGLEAYQIAAQDK
jgi:uncharacterized tellurite resistance protein B-like protein